MHDAKIRRETSTRHSLIEQLYQRYWLLIFHAIQQHISSQEEVEDVLVEVFLAALESPVLSTLSEHQQVAWLLRTAYNKSIDYYRHTKRRPAMSLEQTAEILHDDEKRSPERIALHHEELAFLRQGLSSLSELQQEALILRFADGLRCAEIAARLHKSEGAVRTLLSRALNLLRSVYEQKREKADHE